MNEIDFLKQKEVKEFIKDHQKTDVTHLLLHPPARWKKQIRLIADQILARQKAKGKLDSWIAHEDLLFPPPLSIEQASSEETGRYKSTLIQGDHLIDLTGGMGVDCLALGNQFKKVWYVEQNPQICLVFEHNVSVLHLDIQVYHAFAEDFLRDFEGKAVFYLDPGRRDDLKNKVFKLEDCRPNVLELLPMLKEKSSQVLIKLSPLFDISTLLNTVDSIRQIHVVSVKNECKEILVLLDFQNNHDKVKMTAVNLLSGQEDFVFSREEETNTLPDYGELNQYLYEPNASILKAGAFKLTGDRFGLKKLASNTHLYTAENEVKNFPGKIFKIEKSDAKNDVASFAKEGKINVLTRNYTSDAPELKRKYKVKDGGDYFLIGFKDRHDKARLVIAARLDG